MLDAPTLFPDNAVMTKEQSKETLAIAFDSPNGDPLSCGLFACRCGCRNDSAQCGRFRWIFYRDRPSVRRTWPYVIFSGAILRILAQMCSRRVLRAREFADA